MVDFERPIPSAVHQAGVAHAAAGAANLVLAIAVFLVGCLGGGIVTTILGSCLSCPCPIGAVCGLWGLWYVPIGLAELGFGIWTTQAKAPDPSMNRIAAYIEIGAVLVGAIPSVAAGAFVLSLLQDPDVLAYIEDRRAEREG